MHRTFDESERTSLLPIEFAERYLTPTETAIEYSSATGFLLEQDKTSTNQICKTPPTRRNRRSTKLNHHAPRKYVLHVSRGHPKEFSQAISLSSTKTVVAVVKLAIRVSRIIVDPHIIFAHHVHVLGGLVVHHLVTRIQIGRLVVTVRVSSKARYAIVTQFAGIVLYWLLALS